MKLKLTSGVVAPRSGARKEHFYSGELDVFNDEVETDNENWIQQLRERGYTPVDEMTDEHKAMYNPQQAQVQQQGKEYQTPANEQVGTQVVDDDNYEDFIDGVKEEELDSGPVDESHTDEPFANTVAEEDASIHEPSEVENMLFEALHAPPRKGKK